MLYAFYNSGGPLLALYILRILHPYSYLCSFVLFWMTYFFLFSSYALLIKCLNVETQ